MTYSARLRRDLVELLTLAWPVVLSRLGYMSMGLIDTLVVARFYARAVVLHVERPHVRRTVRCARRQFRLRLVVVVIVRQVREISAPGIDASRRRERFVEAHVRRMRLVTQRVQHGNFHAPDVF